MTIPYITPTQQEIPKLIYKFRFLNRLQIQKLLNHKYHNRINDWLNSLTKKQYIEKLPQKNTFEERTKLTIYRIGINGIRFLKTQDDISSGLLRKLYRDKDRSDNFINNQCLFLADIYLDLREQSTKSGSVSYEVTTASEFASTDSPFYFLTELAPHLIAKRKEKQQKKTTGRYHLLEIFEPTLPRYSIRKRLRTYLEFFYSNEWANNTDNTAFPIIFLICPTKPFLIYVKRFTKKLLEEEQNPEDLDIQFTIADQVKEFGVTGASWEEV
ncbi:MAG: replication-relaxation family protein [Candidatus Daviesbacteria bacterium]|nr:replication-relaxation family protein [Candidatus Daviesbacteria bacterium]